GLWTACLSALAPGTTFTTYVRLTTGRITSAASGIRSASMIASGSSAMCGSTIMTGDSEAMNSASMILIADAGSMKGGSFMGAILIADAGPMSSTIVSFATMAAAGPEDMKVATGMDVTTEDGTSRFPTHGLAAEAASFFVSIRSVSTCGFWLIP